MSARAHPESSPCFFTPLIVRFTSFYAQAYVHGSGKEGRNKAPPRLQDGRPLSCCLVVNGPYVGWMQADLLD